MNIKSPLTTARNVTFLGALALQLILGQPALAADHDKAARPDIVATAIQAGSFKTLAKALTAADLVEALQGKGPFTVLAPTDEAFAKLPAGTLESLLKPENKARLQAILKYHVVSGRVPARQVAGLESARTLSGSDVTISVADGQLRVNQSRVIKTDVAAGNGIIHVIDTVLLPPADSMPGASKTASPAAVVETAIERGVPLFNHGNTEACAAVYEVAALGLAGRQDVPKDARTRLKRALAESANQKDWSARAWTLRRGLDESRGMMN
jgi:uncharacterized surface protein with fasciclin (FAS1) repeats